jgi:hypothetical protein
MSSRARTDPVRPIAPGETIPDKGESPILLAAFGVVLLALGGVCWLIHLSLKEWLEWRLFPMGGVVLTVCGVLALLFALLQLLRPVSHSLVIGDDRLQVIENGEKVVQQYHYEDVLGYTITGKVIGIGLKEPVSGQAILPDEGVRAYLMENYGHRAIIEPRVMCPAQELVKKLETCLQRYARAKRGT